MGKERLERERERYRERQQAVERTRERPIGARKESFHFFRNTEWLQGLQVRGAMDCYRERPLWENTQELNRIIKGGLLSQLHSEIKRFHELISPTPEEQQQRNSAVSRFRDVAELLWPSCEVRIYGSFATGLHLPSSDIDLVILNTGWLNTQDCLPALEAHLNSLNFAFDVEVLSKARVPIIKFGERESGLSFDVRVVDCSANLPELHAVEMIKQWSTKDLPARPLYMVLKTYLQQEKLNEVFHSGGIASYMLFVMLRTYLQASELGFEAAAQAQTMKVASTSQGVWMGNYGPAQMHDSPNVSLYTLSTSHGKTAEMSRPGQLACTEPCSQPLFKHKKGVIDWQGLSKLGIESYTYLGILLIGFFHFYGICFNSELYGLSCRGKGSFFLKEAKGFRNPLRPFLLAVEDPLTPSNDIGKNSFNYQGIRAAFVRTYEALTSSYPTSNLLYCIIPLAKKWERRQRGKDASAVAGLQKVDSTPAQQNVRKLGTPTSSKVHHTNQPDRDTVARISRLIWTILDESVLQGDQERQLALLKLLDDLGENEEVSGLSNLLQTSLPLRCNVDLATLLSTNIQVPVLTLIQASLPLRRNLKEYLKRAIPVITLAPLYSRGWVHPELGKLDAGC